MRTKLLALLSLGITGLIPAATAQEIPLTRIDIDVAQEKAEIAPAVPIIRTTSEFMHLTNRFTPLPSNCEAGVFRGTSRILIRAGR